MGRDGAHRLPNATKVSLASAKIDASVSGEPEVECLGSSAKRDEGEREKNAVGWSGFIWSPAEEGRRSGSAPLLTCVLACGAQVLSHGPWKMAMCGRQGGPT